MEQDYCVKQIIDEHGNFNVTGLDEFVEEVKLSRCGISYVVVAIMGPQSSGKSTLLNHLFQTNFREMDPEGRRKQTTRGIWIANCVGIEPCTIALDLEGNDGRERGPDGTAFEKQIALFALAVSDIMLINMWCHDIGREHAGNKPLLRTIFQVMMRLFGPGHKATLVFVVRDRSNKMPYSELVAYLLDDVDKLWTEVPKPQEHTSTRLNDIFRVEVVSLPNYEMEEDIFKEQVAQLRQRFSNSISPGGLAACNRHHVVPAAGFSLSAQKFWEIIKDNRDLDLPSQKNDMVDEVNSRKEEYQEKHPETTEEEITVHLQSQEAEVLDKVLEPPKGNHIKGMGRAGQRDSSFPSNGRGSTSRSRPPTVDEQQLQEVWEHYEQRLKETQNLAKQQIEEVQQRGQQQIEAMQSQLAALYAHLGMTPPPPTPTPPPQFRQPSPPQQVSPSSDDSNNI